MQSLNVIGVIACVLYTPFLFAFTAVTNRIWAEKWAADPGRRARFHFKTSLVAVWVLLGFIVTIITLQGQWSQYIQKLWTAQSFVPAVLIGLFGGLFLFNLAFYTQSVLGRLMGHRINWGAPASKAESLAVLQMYTSPWMVPLMIVMNAAEEFVFRGFLLTVLSVWTGNWLIAVVISSFIYGSYHYVLGPRDAVIHGINGGAYGTVVVFSGGMFISYLMHITYNLLAVWVIRKRVSKWLKYKTT